MRILRPEALLLLTLLLMPTLAAQEPTFRAPTARATSTIFSPLELPPANSLRTATNVYGAEGGMEYPVIIFCRVRSERGV